MARLRFTLPMGNARGSSSLLKWVFANGFRQVGPKVLRDGVTGGGDFMKRPNMVALLSYLDVQPSENYVVIFDDLKRFARDTRFHLDLRDAFRLRSASIE